MWWLLLVWIEGDVYAAHSVHDSVEQCAIHATVGDRCVQAEVKMIELPVVPEVVVTVLPEEQNDFAPQMGPAE